MSAHVGDSLVGRVWVPSWQADSACLTEPDLPWTEERVSTADQQRMTVVCGGCPVAKECAALAQETAVTAGFWAGVRYTLGGARDPEPVAPLLDLPWLNPSLPGPPAWAAPEHGEQLELGLDLGMSVGAA